MKTTDLSWDGEKIRQINDELNRLETSYQRPSLTSYPPFIQISTGSRCNLRCVFCTDRSPRVSRQYRNLSLEEFLPLTEGLAYASTVQLNGWGEPFFNKDYESIFDYVRRNYDGVLIYISTNGTLFGPKWQKKLLEYENYVLNVSINAASRDTYHTLTGKNLFSKVLTNLKKFTKHRDAERGRRNGHVSVSFVVVQDNLEEIPAFVDLAAEVKADHVHFMDLMYLGEESQALAVTDREIETRQYFKEAVRRAQQRGIMIGSFLTYGTSEYLTISHTEGGGPESDPQVSPEKEANYCFAPWNSLLLSADGTATVCCRAGSVMGNVRNEGLNAVWNGPMYQYFRSAVNTAEPPADCRHCPVKTGLART